MSHNHAPGKPDTLGGRLLLAMLINLLIPVAQFAGGLFAGSMALISDAVHNLGDFTALSIAYGAHKAGRRGPTLRHTFGLRRMEIFAAVANATLLGGSAVFIAIEALKRLADPAPVMANVVAVLALVGIIGNGLSAWLLYKDSGESLNARGAFLHMIGDLLTSVAVLIGALIMRVATVSWLDPALSLAIVVYILVNCFSLLKEAVHVLMNGTPKGLDLQAVQSVMEKIPGVNGIHFLHAWSIGEKSVALTCHVVVSEQPVSATETLAHSIKEKLIEEFGIDHPVLQFETKACGQGALLCQMACGAETACPQTA